MPTIVLVDDHPVVRQGLRALLEAEPGFRVIGEAGEGVEAVQLVERLQPDVLVLDLMIPGLNGLEVTRQVSRRSSRTRVVILSMHANEAYVLEALRNGALGYVLKDAGATELLRAVREVAAGRRYLSPPLSERAIEIYVQKTDAAPLDLYETLTTREREVLQLAAEGYSATEIADRLSISSRTVETHRANLMRKLGLRTQTDLIRYALRRGILPMEDNLPLAEE
ncbi:MAG: response regulator transcription factor [Candidatus Tectomicrobia bacterium]|uniref:Response regulator transcription factor n=1 Tax=Tectimicrobiota bacterium TaxID=2528274 RepID=A0A932CL32_UNCTE|nr:response regulator transcription factor [Candidatus Tectomicrobia bacterium]